MPHLVGPVIVYSTLIVATNIIAEAGLSFLGLGIQEPTSSWGNILSRAPEYYLTQPEPDDLARALRSSWRRSRSTCSATGSGTRSTRARRREARQPSNSPLTSLAASSTLNRST